MSKQSNNRGNFNSREKKRTYQDRDQQGEDFMFNRTSLLSSALQKLKKKNNKTSTPKPIHEQPIPLPGEVTTKKIKTTSEVSIPSLTYTPLQKDLYNFYTVNKISLKSFENVPQPKLQVGSLVLTAVCDRGIGGKYLVTNLFRNKKAYIDYFDVPLIKGKQQSAIQALQAYHQPGDYLVGSVVKPRNQGKIQLSLSQIEEINEKELRIGQVLISQIKSKEELGCHLCIKGLKKSKAYLPKTQISQQAYQQLQQNKQLIVSIKEIDDKKQLIKVIPITQEQIQFNLKGIQESQLSKYQLQHYIVPGTLLNTKIIKKLNNGILVKFLKIFIGFIHADHLQRELTSYNVEEKIVARIIYACNNPPTIFLSQRHKTIQIYQPKRPLYSMIQKPTLTQIQHSYINIQQQFFAHPLHLHSEIQNISKLWSKQNNYFQHYQIMSSKKLGLKVGDIQKIIPFTNFKVSGQGVGKFRVMCLDIWNKILKISYNKTIINAKNLLFDQEQIQQNQKYCGFISNVNQNGVVVQFCNNIKGIVSQRELQINGVQIGENNIGQAMEVYVSNSKKHYLGLTITPPDQRKNKKEIKNSQGEGTSIGVIQSIQEHSIHPIYIKIKNKLIKINIFDGIRPASLQDLPIIQNIKDNFTVGEKAHIFSKKGKYYLYPPEQLSDKNLRFGRVLSIQGNTIRIQTKQDEFRSCHICDITDLISPHPLHQVQIGEYVIGRIVGQKNISLRKSVVLQGFANNMQQVVEKYGVDQKKGDYRGRLDAVGPSSLKLQSVTFGYIKNYSDKGCFISLGRDFDVRVDKSELSDRYIPNKQQVFTPNKIVLCRLIHSKSVVNGKQTLTQIDASLRESVVKYGYPLNDQILETGVGLTVYGIVTGYSKGKALVRLQSSKFTGIISLRDYEEAGENDTLEKALPIGKQIICKITEYSREGEKRLIRLSTQKKHFKKYEGLETTFDCDDRITQLWQHFQQLSAIQVPERQEMEVQVQQNLEEAQYQKLKKLLELQKMNVQEDNQGEDSEDKQEEEMDVEQQNEEDEGDEEKQEMEDEQMYSEEAKRQKIKNQKEEMSRRVAQFEPLPHSKQFYQSLVLANPTPQSHLLYISSLLPTASPEEIRSHFQKAINSLSSIKDKDTMWISWLNTELILGDFTGTVKKAVEASVGHTVYFRIMQLLSQQQNWHLALQFSKKTLKKFNRQPKAYIQFLKLLSRYQKSGHNLSQQITPKQILRRASQCLKSNEITQIQIHHAKNQFDIKQSQQGRNIFQKLISKYPKRTDLWSVYIDQQIKCDNIDKARNLLQRALSLNLKKKSSVSLLKKYLGVEKKYGSQHSVQKIIERAQKIAAQYQNIDEDDDEIEDIQ